MPVVFLYFKPRTVTAIGTHQPKEKNQLNKFCFFLHGHINKSFIMINTKFQFN